MTLSVTHGGKIYAEHTVEDMLEAGVPQSAIDVALASERLITIKVECGRRIYAIASAETQMNIATSAAVIGGKTAASRSSDETATLVAAGQAIAWVATMKANVATLAGDANADISADTSWPDCPEIGRAHV